MLRFKQFLILEDATITTRQHLESVYGKEKAAEMIAKIREREQQKGSAEGYADATQEFHKRTSGFYALNPFLDKQKLAQDITSKFKLDSDTQKTGNRFAIPIYSDNNLDKPITVKAVDPSEFPDYGYGFKTTALADATPVGEKGGSDPVIRVNNKSVQPNMTDPLVSWIRDPQANNDRWYSRTYSGGPKGDLLGHEVTHTVQPGLGYETKPEDLGKTEYNSDKPASPERLKRREYTQNAFEPAARMSELKHAYFRQTNRLLKADMTPEEKEAFKAWQNDPNNGFKTGDFDDTMQLLDTPEGDELFRRTAKVDNQNRSNIEMA